jgi:hypothetical protein
MQELAHPFIRAWEWVGRVGGFPGQAFAIVAVLMTIIGLLTWLSNKK